MKNFEKHSLEELLSLMPVGYAHPAVVSGRLVKCAETNCKDCEFYSKREESGRSCDLEFIKWLYSDADYDDMINHPSHYTDGKIEVIDYIEDKGLGFCLGNAVKYISRAGKKDQSKEVEDLQKAVWYIQRKIEQISKEKTE